jgi:general secretion pathway protein G
MRIRRINLALHRAAAFTFMEIILVVTIIGILAGIVLPRLVGQSKEAKVKATIAQMQNVKTALGHYEVNVGDFPSTSQGLKALIERPSSVHEDDWKKLMERVPTDAWGQEFIYSYPSSHGMDFDISSRGPDRQEGTDDDITNWGEGN